MKKLLSITAMLALVISLFSGVSFAAAPSNLVEVVVDQDTIVMDMSPGFQVFEINGRIVNEYGSRVNINTTVWIEGGTSFPVTNGSFTMNVIGSMLNVGRYDVDAASADGFTVVEGETTSNSYSRDEDNITVIPEIELDNDVDIDFEFPVPGTVIVSGTLPNADGDYYDLAFGYLAANGYSMSGPPIQILDIYGNDTFGGMFGGSEMGQAGDVAVFAKEDGGDPNIASGYVAVIIGEVSPAELDVTVSPDSVPHSLDAQPITFDFNLDSDYTSGSELEDNYTIKYTITESDGTPHGPFTILDDDDRTFDDRVAQKVTSYISCQNWEEGTADIKVELFDGGTVIMDADLEIDIVDPDDYTLVGWSLDTASVGTLKLGLPNSSGGYPTEDYDQAVRVVQFDDGEDNDCDFIEIVAEGCGVDATFTNYESGSVDDRVVSITTTETGTLDITINVYSNATDTTPDESFTREVEITGFNVTYTPNTIEVDSSPDVVVVVIDEDGTPINNAKIYIDGNMVVNGGSVSINGGTYVYEDDDLNLFEDVGFLDLKVTGYNNGIYSEVIIEDAIEVVGEEVYTIEADIDSLVNGTQEVFYLEVYDDDGDVIYPEFTRINVDEDGNRTAGATVSTGSYYDLDGDGVRESVKVTLTPTYNQTELIIRGTTDSGKKIGEITLPVNPPAMAMNGDSTATENIYAHFDFTILDPRNDGLLDENIYLRADDEYVDFRVKDEDGDTINVGSGISSDIRANSDDEYIFRIFVNDVDWDKLADDDEEAIISVYYKSGTSSRDDDIKMMEIPVLQASLTADPAEIIVGTGAQITLTYVDGEGNPLEGFMIMENGVEIGETNENGMLYHQAIAGTAIQLTYEAETNDSDDDDSEIDNPSDDNEDTIYTVLAIKPGIDTTGPVASAPATVPTTQVMVTIEDPSGVARYMINGVRYEPFFPAPKVVEFVTLQPGMNTLLVVGVDSKGYMGTTTLNIMCTAGGQVTPPSDTVTFQIGQTTKYGTPVLMDGTTMVPVRFAEDLGATMAWNNITKTATYTLGNTVVSVTLGNRTATVNGEAVLMPQAPYLNEAGRTMVPLRMIAQELGFTVNWVGNDQPISIVPNN